MKEGDLLRVWSSYQYDTFQMGDLLFVLAFFKSNTETKGWKNSCEMVRVLSKLGIVELTRSSLEKATLVVIP